MTLTTVLIDISAVSVLLFLAFLIRQISIIFPHL